MQHNKVDWCRKKLQSEVELGGTRSRIKDWWTRGIIEWGPRQEIENIFQPDGTTI